MGVRRDWPKTTKLSRFFNPFPLGLKLAPAYAVTPVWYEQACRRPPPQNSGTDMTQP
jgi:hypothetical protein